jgi:pepsin A
MRNLSSAMNLPFFFNKGDSKYDRAGNAVLWGGVDPAFYEGKIEYFPVTDPYYWSIDLQSFQVGDNILVGNPGVDASHEQVNGTASSLLETSSRGGYMRGSRSSKGLPKAIIDTGTTFFTAEGNLYSKIVDLLPNAKCSDISDKTHPPITYKLVNAAGGASSFKFVHKDYMTQDGDGDNAQCHLAFMRINVPEAHGPAMILGELFLRSYFSVFDRGNGAEKEGRVGFAQAKHGAESIARLAQLTDKQPHFAALGSD